MDTSKVTKPGPHDGETTALPSSLTPGANQPTAIELSQLAVTLARTLDESVTPENREGLLRDAYDLWRAADELIKERKSDAERDATARETKSCMEIVKEMFGKQETKTFQEIADQRILPKRVGKKGKESGESQCISSAEGVKKAFNRFWKSVVGPAWAVGESRPLGDDAFLFRDEPASKVLKSRTMSMRMLRRFVEWQKMQSDLKNPSTE